MDRGLPVRAVDAARASENFELFLNASTLKSILGTYRNICDLLHLKPNALPAFYPRLKAHLTSWRAKALWKKFDARASSKCYGKGKQCANTRVLIIGAGPCGLRSAIEAQLLGAKVVVVEKRDRISRNNVLHLWPFVIDDLRLLGAKKFFGKFCAGAIDHISIRQLQCILLKVALLLGVEIHTDVSFEKLIEPDARARTGWTAEFRPLDHPVQQFEFDVVIGADGKRNTLQGFKRKELRCKLAIAITANFINKRTEAEARVEEISGVAFIFNQKFFKDLFAATGIDLENIVYYKDDTHYFVMTAKKQSLLEKGVILHDLQDTAKLLAHENVDRVALMKYAREAAEFSTKYNMLDLEFAVNHYGQPDVAMFDFTSMYQAENASRIIERHGYRLMAILVGDSLLEPFWPTGSGCARGFLSSLDAGWAIRGFASPNLTPLEVLAERESIYRLLPQTTPENLNRDYKSYTLDPATRYPNLNKNLLLPQQVLSLFDTDDVQAIKLGTRAPIAPALDVPKKRRRTESIADPDTLLNWIREQIKEHDDLECNDFTYAMRDGRVLCAIINHYRPDLLDYATVTADKALVNNQVAFDVLDKDLGIAPAMHAKDMMEDGLPDQKTMVAYLTLVYEKFRREIPHVKHPKLRALSSSRRCVPDRLKKSKFSIVSSSWETPPSPLSEETQLLVNIVDCSNELENLSMRKSDLIAESAKLQMKIDKAFKAPSASCDHADASLQTEKCLDNDLLKALELIKEGSLVTSAYYLKAKAQRPDIVVNDDGAVHQIKYNSNENCVHIIIPKSKIHTEKSRICHKYVVNTEREYIDNPVTADEQPTLRSNHQVEQVVHWLNSNNFTCIPSHCYNPASQIEIVDKLSKNELPEPKRNQTPSQAFTKNHPVLKPVLASLNNKQLDGNSGPLHLSNHRASGKHRKRRTLDKLSMSNVEERMKRLEEIAINRNERQNKRRQQRRMQTEQFIKSMQMLQANDVSSSSEPFEDYSIFVYRQTAPNFEDRVKDLEKKFTYVPVVDRDCGDRENRPMQQRGEKDEEFQARIKGMEDKCMEHVVTERKPKDLLRAIGKIDNTDWNIKEIEKKIIENKLGKNVSKDKEKVPKWSKEQFQARQLKMEKQHLERQDSASEKFAEIDRNIKQLDMKLREGTVREQNRRQVAQITEKLKPKAVEAKPVQKSAAKTAIVLPTPGKSDSCHFCDKRVYLMERLTAEGRFFHRGCFRCQYCHAALRLGSYMFDRDGKYGYRFFCGQHFGMPGELGKCQLVKKASTPPKTAITSPDKKLLSGMAGVDLLDRVQTPERIEFDLSANYASSDQDEPLSQMDEDEWTDRNFGASTAELGSSDDDDYSLSDSDSDDAFEEALEEPATQEGTLKLYNEWFKKRYSRQRDSDSESYSSSERSSYYENSSGDDDTETATEGEEEIQAREQRKLEVKVKPPIEQTGTDTEVASDDETSSSSSAVANSATEVSTDSEFALDERTPTCEIPSIVLNDAFVTKTRGSCGKASLPQKTQVKEVRKAIVSTASAVPATTTSTPSNNSEIKLAPLIQTPLRKPIATPLLFRPEGGFALNRTQSTGGIATKVSLELKKKYLLGEGSATNPIQKSGSASTLDSKLRSFHSTISDCQKLLKPSAEISASMQTFCLKLDEQRTSPLSPLCLQHASTFKPIPSRGKEEAASVKPIIEECEDAHPSATIAAVPNETEGRPRSPVHETSIIVPQIDWSQQPKEKAVTSTSESTTASSESSSEDGKHLQKSPTVKAFAGIAHTDSIPPDSLNFIPYTKIESQLSSITDSPKSIASEKKQLNQPKPLPAFDNDLMLQQVHILQHTSKPEVNAEAQAMSGRSTPSHGSACDQTMAALTETELSDWARDGMVSDDFVESDYEAGLQHQKLVKNTDNSARNRAKPELANDGEEQMECISNILCPKLDNIEFMDTGSESSPDELIEAKNNGYVQFHDEDEVPEDSLSPVAEFADKNTVAVNKTSLGERIDPVIRTTSYGFGNERNPYGGEVIDLKPKDLEKLKEKQSLYDNEEDSLIIVEKSTTDDNTCSDSTVKNVTEIPPKEAESPLSSQPHIVTTENNNAADKNKRMEDKLAQVKKDMKKISEQRKAAHIEEQNMRNNIEFEQHCQRLQSKVDFGNAKDSIDIRKARRQSKSGSPPKPDLIQEEKETTSPMRSRKEQIEMERDMNKKLIQEMVMNKMRAENKSLERKRRNRNFSPSLSPCRPYEVAKSPTTDVASLLYHTTPDVLLSTLSPQKTSTLFSSKMTRPLSAIIPSPHCKDPIKIVNAPLGNKAVEAYSLPDIQKATSDDFKTPKAPPRAKNLDGTKSVEKLKEDARARARLLSDEDLGLSPEEKLARLRVRLARRGKENEVDAKSTNLYSNDTLNKKKHAAFRRSKSGDDHLNVEVTPKSRERTKSFCEGNAMLALSQKSPEGRKEGNGMNYFQSDPNLQASDAHSGNKKKEKTSKDRERRKSITKLIADLFGKKKDFNVTTSPTSACSKGFFSRISPKNRDKAKDIVKEPVRRFSCTDTAKKCVPGNVSPPPIPPLPLNYTGAKSVDESTDGEAEWRQTDRSSCDTLDQGSFAGPRSSSRSVRRAKQSQSKRHRTAQEIQRKLEETEVKTRELELCGVRIEQALRGECEISNKDETQLLKEWFDLMKDITELRRYERELLVRAQELELEDRHARLQHELKDRFTNDVQESAQEIETKGGIIKEMLDIVATRNSLIALLDDERLRYCEEDRELEEQMLAKGIDVSAKLSHVRAAATD